MEIMSPNSGEEITSSGTLREDIDTKMTRDLIKSAKLLSKQEVRYLVDIYYTMQDQRIRTANQVRIMKKAEGEEAEPCEVLEWLFGKSESLEEQIKRALKSYAESSADGEWAMGVVGIGPVITAGLLSHIDITKAPTVGHIWSFAGLVPGVKWEKKQKRPWNAALKRLCGLIGQSFMRNSGRESCVYGKIYRERKVKEVALNDAFAFRAQAETILKEKKIDKETDAYKAYIQGKLPPAQIEQRAERYATKLFIAHLHEVMYKNHFKVDPPKPYPIAILGHAHYIKPA
mgnify:CR=1 FL=1